MANDAGVLGRICTLIGEQRANITDIVFTDRKPDFFRMVIDIEVRDMEHLTHVLTAIDADSDVAQVRRFRQSGRPQGGVPRMSAAPGGEVRPWSSSDATSRPSRTPARGAAAARRLAPRGSSTSGTGSAGCPTPRTASRSASPSGSSPRSPRSSACTSCSALALAACARQHDRRADRHLRRQPADLAADRLDLARPRPPILGYGASGATSAGSATPSPRPRAASGHLLGLVGLGESEWGRLEPFSTSSSGPTSSAACCRGSSRDRELLPAAPLVAAYQARRRTRMLARARPARLAEKSG